MRREKEELESILVSFRAFLKDVFVY